MIKFEKIPDGSNKFDITKVQISVEYGDLTISEIVETFEQFLLAIGFSSELVKEIFNRDE